MYRILLLVAGYAWMLSIPSTLHGQGTYIDENALQPGQVSCNISGHSELVNGCIRSTPTGPGEMYITQINICGISKVCIAEMLQATSNVNINLNDQLV